MTLDQIIALVVPGESETLECKTSTGTRREAARTVCAMLNQRGETVLFGVAPDGNVLGQHVGERTIEEVGAEIRRIEAPAFPRGRTGAGGGRPGSRRGQRAPGADAALHLPRHRLPPGREYGRGPLDPRVRADAQRPGAGRISRQPAGRSKTSTRTRFIARLPRRFGAAHFFNISAARMGLQSGRGKWLRCWTAQRTDWRAARFARGWVPRSAIVNCGECLKI